MLLPYAFLALLAVSVASFVAMGLGKVRRTRRLARAAHEGGRRFFADDPYDVPRRYGEFAVISAGHSPRANNVTDGRLGGLPVRAFDFRYELGHGTRRITRHYSIVEVQTPWRLPGLLMWHGEDAELAPLVARDPQRRVGPWGFRGPPGLASAIAEACPALARTRASVELRGSVVMACAPAGAAGYAIDLGDLEPAIAAIPPALAAGQAPAAPNSPDAPQGT